MAGFYILSEALEEEERIVRRKQRRRQREFHLLRYNILPDAEFISSYRLSRELFELLCQNIIPLMPQKKHPRGIDPVTRILAALSFLARGSYQGAVAQNWDAPMSQQAVSKSLHIVLKALNTPNILRKYIRFPQNTEEQQLLKRRFFALSGIPGIIGCIDCTHVAIIRPALNEERYLNRKHFHSLNVQVIVDSDMYILNLDASYGGATHDAFIWNNSEIKEYLENSHETSILLGDSGYPLREYLMTPIDNAEEYSPEWNYNRIHKRTRSIVERAFGVLKGRWRCLLAARELHYNPQTAAYITIACVVLHNICIRGGLVAPELTEEDIARELNHQSQNTASDTNTQAFNRGRRSRAALVQLINRSAV